MEKTDVFTKVEGKETDPATEKVETKPENGKTEQRSTVNKVLGEHLTKENLVVGIKLPKAVIEEITLFMRQVAEDATKPTDMCVSEYISSLDSGGYPAIKAEKLEPIALAWQTKQQMRVRFSIEKLKQLETIRMSYAEKGKECSQEFALILIILEQSTIMFDEAKKVRSELLGKKLSDEEKVAAERANMVYKLVYKLLRFKTR